MVSVKTTCEIFNRKIATSFRVMKHWKRDCYFNILPFTFRLNPKRYKRFNLFTLLRNTILFIHMLWPHVWG